MIKQKEFFNELIQILDETQYFIKTQKLPVRRFESEPDPHDISFVWKPMTKKSKEQKQKETQEKQRTNREVVNFACSLCTNKTSGVRNFFYRGRKPILVLHYSGATSLKEKPFVKRIPSQVFKDDLTGLLWNDLINKSFHFSSEELYYQEYPACNFNVSLSQESDWQKRMESCRIYVDENIKDFKLEGIILLGSSAKLIFGAEVAKEMVGKIIFWQIDGKEIPVLTLRSPEALVFLDVKSKQNPADSSLFHFAEEKNILEASFLKSLLELSEKIHQ